MTLAKLIEVPAKIEELLETHFRAFTKSGGNSIDQEV